MPQKRTHLQMSFEEGMVERPLSKKDFSESMLKWQAPQTRSALYIENFDPGLVPGTLIKRKGSALARETVWNEAVGLQEGNGYPTGYDQIQTITCDLERFTLLIDVDPDIAPQDSTDKATILGATMVAYNKPAQQPIDVVFVRDVEDVGATNHERTRIIARCKTTPTGTMKWREPHINGTLIDTGSLRTSASPSIYPGWEISGTLADVTRHGGTVICATNVATELWPNNADFNWSVSWVDELYPCYVWTYWDLRRKRKNNKFWNIIDNTGTTASVTVLNDLTDNYTADDKYSIFKVLTPSLYPSREELVTFANYTYNASAGNGSMLTGGNVLSNMSGFVTDAPGSAIEIVILETRSRYYAPSRPVLTVPSSLKMDEYDSVLAATQEYVFLNEDTLFLETIETLKVGGTTPLTIVQNRYLEGDTPPASVHFTTGNSDELGWGIRQGRLETGEGSTRQVQVVVGPGHTNFKKAFKTDPEESYTAYIGVAIPDYLSNQNPRYWIQGEKIPLVVTLKIRGVEIVAGSHLYTVGTVNPQPNYSLFSGQVSNSDVVKNVTPGTQHNLTYNHTTAYTEQQELMTEKSPRFNGVPMVPVVATGWYFNTDAGGADPRWASYDAHYPFQYEPFNPTQQPPFLSDPGDGYAQKYYYSPIGYDTDTASLEIDNESPGYRRRTTSGTMIFVAVKIHKDSIGQLLELGVEAINVYVAKPGESSIMRSKGTRIVEDPDQGQYMFPTTIDLEDYSKYALIKSYLLDGDGSPFADATDIARWKADYYGTPTSTNGWLEESTHLISCGQDKNGDPNGILTPDFILYDYPTDRSLSLNSSGRYWQGRGASVITSIKGRTFIGGCIDQYGELEQGLIRYSDVQNGVISLDVFSEEGYIKLGGNPHTAFAEFREQLWAFSRQEVYRMQMRSITDVTTWEYLDKYSGQGTYSPKTVIATPFGVIWCNESGVWVSDGRDPDNIVQPILTVYQTMATNQPPYYATKFPLPTFPYDDNGINPYLEISYDEEANEIVVSSPTMTGIALGDNGPNLDWQNPNEEFRLTYSIETRTWHVETWDHPPFGTYLNEFDENGTLEF